MTNTLLGIFSQRMSAENAIAELERDGFNPRDISLIMKDQTTGQTVTHQGGSNMAEGAVSGAATGGVLGALAGLLVGVGAIAIPGIGALLVAGPLTGIAAATVSGAVTGVVAGGLVGGLIGLGIPEEEAKVIEGRIREGGILVAVPVLMEEEAKVRQVFQNFGADMVRVISQGERQREVFNQNYQAYEPKVSLSSKDEPKVSLPVEDGSSGSLPSKDESTITDLRNEPNPNLPRNNPFPQSPSSDQPPVYQEPNPVYYSDIKRETNYDHNLDDLAAHNSKRSFWEKLKDLFS
jgi:uncharacterized membrane protein